MDDLQMGLFIHLKCTRFHQAGDSFEQIVGFIQNDPKERDLLGGVSVGFGGTSFRCDTGWMS